MQIENQKPRRFRRILKRGFRWGEHIFAIIGFILVVYSFGFNLSVVVSGSMAPTLKGTATDNGDLVLTEKFTYRLRRPQRWEVVAYRTQEGTQVMKRVAGLPAEDVSIHKGRMRINGAAVPAPDEVDAIKYLACGNVFRGKVAPCGEGFYVLGDDTHDSQDSRFEGPLERKRITGRPWLILWPPTRFGFVNP